VPLACYALFWHNSFVRYPVPTWKAFAGLALISTVCGQMTFNWLLRWLPAAVISMSILGETVGTCILAYFILGEAVSVGQGIGICVILSGLALFYLRTKAPRVVLDDEKAKTLSGRPAQ
jgi:drug/metabolite transporter (DMT)-like permease